MFTADGSDVSGAPAGVRLGSSTSEPQPVKAAARIVNANNMQSFFMVVRMQQVMGKETRNPKVDNPFAGTPSVVSCREGDCKITPRGVLP
jgi:hypothetical protein